MIGYLQVTGGVLIWAVINGLVIKSMSGSVAPTTLGALMSFIGVVLYGPYLIRESFPTITRKQKLLLVGLGISAALNNSFFYTAIAVKNVSEVALVHYFASVLAIIWLAVIPLFKEKIDGMSLTSVIIGLFGLVIMIGGNGFRNELWLYMALLSALFYSFEIIFSRQVSENGVSAHFSSFTKLSFQFAIMPVVGAMLGHSFIVASESYLSIIVAGLLLYLSFILVFSGLKHVPGKHFAILGYLDRLGAVAIGIVWWRESFGLNVWLGGLLILAAEVPVIFSKLKRH